MTPFRIRERLIALDHRLTPKTTIGSMVYALAVAGLAAFGASLGHVAIACLLFWWSGHVWAYGYSLSVLKDQRDELRILCAARLGVAEGFFLSRPCHVCGTTPAPTVNVETLDAVYDRARGRSDA